jgi:hypothetical protein
LLVAGGSKARLIRMKLPVEGCQRSAFAVKRGIDSGDRNIILHSFHLCHLLSMQSIAALVARDS